jgi:hypothetical protein
MTLAAALLALALQDASAFKHENTEANLKQLFEKLQKAIASGDEKTALALTNPLIPDEASLKKGLKDGVAPEALAQATEFIANIPADDAKRARLFKADPANTDVRVHGSTTEDIAKYEKGSAAFMHFPGGTRKLAETVLRPGMT